MYIYTEGSDVDGRSAVAASICELSAATRASNAAMPASISTASPAAAGVASAAAFVSSERPSDGRRAPSMAASRSAARCDSRSSAAFDAWSARRASSSFDERT